MDCIYFDSTTAISIITSQLESRHIKEAVKLTSLRVRLFVSELRRRMNFNNDNVSIVLLYVDDDDETSSLKHPQLSQNVVNASFALTSSRQNGTHESLPEKNILTSK